MATVGYATLQIIPSMRGMQGEMRKQLGGLTGVSQQVGREAGRGFMGNFASNAVTGLDSMGGSIVDTVTKWSRRAAIAGGVVLGAGLWGGLQRVLDTEDARKTFGQIGLEVGEIDRLMEALQDRFETGPFAYPDVYDVSSQLAASGVEMEDLVSWTGAVGDLAAFAGADLAHVGEITGVIGAQGRVTATELNRLSQMGVPIRQILADGLGVTGDELREMVSAGELSSDMFFELISEADQFDGAMESFADTTRGAWEIMKSGIAGAGEALLAPWFGENGTMVGFLQSVNSWIFDRLQPTMERWGQWLFAVGVPALQSLGGTLRDRVIPVVETAIGWFDRNREMIGRIARAVGPAVVVIGALATTVHLVSRALRILGITTPIGIIMALATAFIYAWQNSETFRNIVTGAIDWVRNAFTVAWDVISGFFQRFTGDSDDSANVFVRTWETVSGTVSTVWDAITGAFRTAIDWIKDLVARVLGSEIATELMATFDHWKEIVSSNWEDLQNMFSAAFAVVAAIWSAGWEWVKTITTALWDWFGPYVMVAIDGVWGYLQTAWDAIVTVFRVAWELIQGLVVTVLRLLRGDVDGAMERIRETITNVMGIIRDFWSRTWTRIREFAQQAWERIRAATADNIERARVIIANTMARIQERWNAVWTAIRLLLQETWRRIRDTVRDFIENVRNRIRTTMDAISARWRNTWTIIRTLLYNIWNQMRDRIRDRITAIRDRIRDTMRAIRDIWRDLWTAIRTRLYDIWNQMRDRIRDRINAIRDRIRNVMLAIRDAWRDRWTQIRTRLYDIWNQMRDRVRDRINAIRDRIRDTMRAIVDAWRERWRSIRSIAIDLIGRVRTGVQTTVERMRDALGTLMDGIRNRFARPLNWVIRQINRFTSRVVSMVNAIPGVNISIGTIDELELARNKGGIIPGRGPDRDTRVAAVTPGEMVVNRSSTRANRDLLDEMNRRPGRALGNIEGSREVGGIQSAADKARPPFGHPDYPGPEAGYRVGRGAPIPGRLRGSETISALRAFARASGVPHRFTSGYRVGSTTYHGRARAADFAPPSPTRAGYRNTHLRNLFNAFAGVGGSLRELILSGAPFRITGGRRRSGDGGGRLRATHWDHVHAATNSRNLGGAGRAPVGDDGDGGGWFDPFASVRAWVERQIDTWFDNSEHMTGWVGDAAKGVAKHVVKTGMEAIIPSWGGGDDDGDIPVEGGGSARAIVRRAAEARGWGGQWGALNSLINRESSWNPNAANPTSTARGLFQFLAATRRQYNMPWPATVEQQTGPGLRYIADRYGNPNSAWAFWQRNRWYADGGYFTQPSVIGVGEAGPEYALPEARLERVAQEAADAAVERRMVVELSAEDRKLLAQAANAQDVDVHVQAWSERFSWRQVRDELARHEVV